jgi:hypothetical protein
MENMPDFSPFSPRSETVPDGAVEVELSTVFRQLTLAAGTA